MKAFEVYEKDEAGYTISSYTLRLDEGAGLEEAIDEVYMNLIPLGFTVQVESDEDIGEATLRLPGGMTIEIIEA